MWYIIVACVCMLLSISTIIALDKLGKLGWGDEVPLFFVGFLFSLLWIITVPITIVGGIAYGLGCLIAKAVKKLEKKREV